MSRRISSNMLGGIGVSSGVRNASSFCGAVSSPGLKPRMPSRTRAAFMRLMILVRSPHQDFALAAGTPGVFFLERGDRHHFAVTRLAAQPSQKHADEHLSIEPIRLGSAGLARYCDTRRMHDEGLDATDPQPSSQPKSIATRLESENGPCDRSASFCRSIPPTLHQMQ